MFAKTLKSVALLPLLLMLCQCDKVQAISKPKTAGPTPYDFPLAFDFTPTAVAKMQSRQDKIVITTFYYGHAKPEYQAKADDMNRLRLGYKEWELPNASRKTTLNSAAIDTKLLSQTKEGEPYVLITVHTVASPDTQPQNSGLRLTPPNNASQAQALPDPEIDVPGERIECRSYTGPVKDLQTQLHTLTCDIATP
jgi:hypothetical protein